MLEPKDLGPGLKETIKYVQGSIPTPKSRNSSHRAHIQTCASKRR
jgi:hypothetical protein